MCGSKQPRLRCSYCKGRETATVPADFVAVVKEAVRYSRTMFVTFDAGGGQATFTDCKVTTEPATTPTAEPPACAEPPSVRAGWEVSGEFHGQPKYHLIGHEGARSRVHYFKSDGQGWNCNDFGAPYHGDGDAALLAAMIDAERLCGITEPARAQDGAGEWRELPEDEWPEDHRGNDYNRVLALHEHESGARVIHVQKLNTRYPVDPVWSYATADRNYWGAYHTCGSLEDGMRLAAEQGRA